MGHSFSLATYLSLTPTHTLSPYLIKSMVAIKLLGAHAASVEIKEIKLGVDFGWVKKLKEEEEAIKVVVGGIFVLWRVRQDGLG